MKVFVVFTYGNTVEDIYRFEALAALEVTRRRKVLMDNSSYFKRFDLVGCEKCQGEGFFTLENGRVSCPACKGTGL